MPTTVNITTLNQLVANLSDIADKHQMINGFQYGEPAEFYQSGMTNSPEMWVMCTGIDRERATTIYNLTIYLADNVKRGEVNELEVESDLIQIAEDVIYQLQNNDYGWNIPQDTVTNIKLMTERTPKNLTVVEFNVSIRTKKPANICAIPFTSNPIT
jgi:hypothetical protein